MHFRNVSTSLASLEQQFAGGRDWGHNLVGQITGGMSLQQTESLEADSRPAPHVIASG